MLIGRVPGNDIVINDALVSRRHAEIRRHGNQITIQDLGSRNGTYVNGRRITTPQVIQPGTELRLGSTTLVLQGDAGPLAARNEGPVVISYPARQPVKDPAMAALIEVLCGFLLGFLGMGWIYAGEITRGLVTLVGYWLLLIVLAVVAMATLGLGLCLVLPLHVAIVAYSAISVKRHVEQMTGTYTR